MMVVACFPSVAIAFLAPVRFGVLVMLLVAFPGIALWLPGCCGRESRDDAFPG